MTHTEYAGSDYKAELDGLLVDSQFFTLEVNEYPDGNLISATIKLSLATTPDLAKQIKYRWAPGDHTIKLISRHQGGKQYLIRVIVENSNNIKLSNSSGNRSFIKMTLLASGETEEFID